MVQNHKQTAVEWLVSELNHCLENNGNIEVVPELLVKLQAQAKQMEKEHIEELESRINELESMLLELGEQQ